MLEIALVFGMLLCAVMVIRAERLLAAALWLAGVSVFTAMLLYRLGAREAAVIELSVGAGLVTVLFVFAISVAGDQGMKVRSSVPKPLAWGLLAFALGLLLYLTLPPPEVSAIQAEASFTETLWQGRALDVLVQTVMIFSGVLGFVGLLSESKSEQMAAVVALAEAESEPAGEAAVTEADMLLEQELV